MQRYHTNAITFEELIDSVRVRRHESHMQTVRLLLTLDMPLIILLHHVGHYRQKGTVRNRMQLHTNAYMTHGKNKRQDKVITYRTEC